jgi:hypothetical protein
MPSNVDLCWFSVKWREGALSFSDYSALRAGIFKASGSTNPMWFREERRGEASAPSFIGSMSPRSYPSSWLRPRRVRFRFARQNHCSAVAKSVRPAAEPLRYNYSMSLARMEIRAGMFA